MTSEKDFIGQLEDYLDDYEGPTPLPESVRDAIRSQLPTTKQVGPLPGPMRYPSMFNLSLAARYGLAAAVLVAAAVVGAAYFGGGANVGSGDTTPTAAPSSQLIEPTSRVDIARELRAGTYTAELPVRVTFTVPDGWNAWAYTDAATQLNLVKPEDAGELSFEIVENVSADPCTRELRDPPVGPGVGDLVSALTDLERFGFDVSPATDVTVDGFSGKRLTMTAPTAVPAGCELTTWRTTTRQNGVGGGEINEVRIIDVGGVRLLISIAHGAGGTPPLTAERRSEIDGIVDSIQLDP
jgi:hypothetical protein